MTASGDLHLSKTRFVGGLQCLKRLYLEVRHPELIPPVGIGQQALFDTGNVIGEMARDLFPGGGLVEENHRAHGRAVRLTRDLASDENIPAIYEAGFTFDNIRTRVDILQRRNGKNFALAEVKSGTSVKPEHIPDAAIQTYVAEGAGLSVSNVLLIHIDNTYVYGGGPYDLDRLFRVEDITQEVRSYMATALPADLKRMRATLEAREQPDVRIGRHCSQPYTCPFYEHCREGLPEHHIEQLPGARAELLEALMAAGVEDIREIPPGFPRLTPLQRRVQECVVRMKPYIGPELVQSMSGLQYPVTFLDFETFSPALPLYPGTRPYQVIPFQWSMHVQDTEGNLEHRAFLHDGADDPRPACIRSLLEAAATAGSIVVYSGYEEARLRSLATELPEYGNRLLALCGRLFDLLKPIRASYYHPWFSWELLAEIGVASPCA